MAMISVSISLTKITGTSSANVTKYISVEWNSKTPAGESDCSRDSSWEMSRDMSWEGGRDVRFGMCPP